MEITGFENEKQLLSALNCSYDNLNSNLKRIVIALFPEIGLADNIKCTRPNSGSKADIEISVKNKKLGVSIKKGSGNSVHQEPIEDFVEFLKSEFNAPQTVCDDLKFFIWGDLTLDGKGNPVDRMSVPQIKKLHKDKIVNFQRFIDLHKEDILKRVLKVGVKDDLVEADYLYYGDKSNGYIVDMDTAIEYLSSKSTCPGLGGLTFQAWNRNLENKKNSTEKKRGEIQFKWGKLQRDIMEMQFD